MDWQLGSVIVCVAFAGLYIGRQTWTTWAGKAGACGGCGSCASTGRAKAAAPLLITTDELTARLRKRG
jgi:7-cyano-7-deazaguanine synthase in queuosine biosynthesis